MNKALIALLAALLLGKPYLKAQNKTTVVTVKGDTLLKKTVKKTTTAEDPIAMAKYYKELEAWKDTVNFLIKQHQENPSAGTLNLPPSPKQPTNKTIQKPMAMSLNNGYRLKIKYIKTPDCNNKSMEKQTLQQQLNHQITRLLTRKLTL